MRRRAGIIGVACAAVALAGLLTACGGGTSGTAVSIKALQTAASNSQAASSTEFTMHLSATGGKKDVDVTAHGVAAADGKTGQLTLTTPSGTLEERVVDGVVYMNVGALSDQLPDGKQWLSLDLDDLSQRLGTDLGGLANQAQNAGPTQGLEYLQGLSGDVEKVGDDTVAGEHAVHYRTSIDYGKVASKVPDLPSSVTDKLSQLGTVPADVWIDDQDRVVKFEYGIEGSALGAGAGTVELSLQITGFGVPVDVQAPRADQTFSFGDLLGGLGDLGGGSGSGGSGSGGTSLTT